MILLINPFTVVENREPEFLRLWDQTNAIFQSCPGYISARLAKASERQAPGQAAPFTHVNVAEWSSRDTYAAALKNGQLGRLVPLYDEVSTFSPALYHIIRETISE